ncbi:MAG: hypothetical protein IT168_31710 [Bryobacterales bacterium]|nr:hypothetical protein [Bryobacterales bacterium]
MIWCALVLAAGLPLDVPLTIQETLGVRREQEPITFGVPLPKALVKDVTRLRLFTAANQPVPAQFRVVNRWWDDGSAQWIHADALASVAAGGTAEWRLRLADTPAPPPASFLQVSDRAADGITVNTGPLQFTMPRKGKLFETAKLQGADILLRSDERIYKLSNAPVSELQVEERTPAKVVLKRTASHVWVNGEDKALDAVIRVIAYAGKPYVRLTYSFVNRQGREMSDFVRLDGLWLQAKLTGSPDTTRVEQLSAEPRRKGWFEAGGVGFGVRWFWQLYPKAFEVTPQGIVRVELFPQTARPQNIYTGVAKTHELLLSFNGEDHWAELEEPLLATAPPKWYTRETKAFGRLVESSPETIKPEHWPLVQKYDQWLAASRDMVLAKRGQGFEFQGRRYDEYGMLNFGDAMHKLIRDDSKPDYGIHWETEYYDFPHALFLHFYRTGDRKSLRTAIEAAAHLADVDISHHEIQSGHTGAARTGPGLNHWTRYSNGVFVSSGSWAFYKNEGLFDRWLLTGDLWTRDVARMSADWGTTYDGLDLQSNTRSIGHGLFAMMKAYEIFGDKKYLDRANWIIDTVHAWQDGNVDRLKQLSRRIVWDPQFKGGYSHQAWMYGIALEAMAQASWTYRRPEMPAYMKRAADWIFQNPKEWDPASRKFLNAPVHGVMLTPGLAYISESTGDPEYAKVAFENFKRQVENEPPTNRLKLFAQLFRNSQRYLWYLSSEAATGPAKQSQ